MNYRRAYRLSAVTLLPLLGVFYGCAGMELAPKRQIWYYHKELPAAERAVETARARERTRNAPRSSPPRRR